MVGLTVHYGLKSKSRSESAVRKAVEKMCQMAMDLPFESVGELVEYTGTGTEDVREAPRENFWLLLSGGGSVRLPWNKNRSRDYSPARLFGFMVDVGPGCEPLRIGLSIGPKEITVEYDPRIDQKFFVNGHFSWLKWRRYQERVGTDYLATASAVEQRVLKTRSTWGWHSFCKTIYANDPECGGIKNFLRCHISVVTLLERIRTIPGITVDIYDEGRYGDYEACPDWKEADAEGRKRVYQKFPGKHSVPDLVTEADEDSQSLAGLTGTLMDAFGSDQIIAPIRNNANFEQLEFQSLQDEDVGKFLELLRG